MLGQPVATFLEIIASFQHVWGRVAEISNIKPGRSTDKDYEATNQNLKFSRLMNFDDVATHKFQERKTDISE